MQLPSAFKAFLVYLAAVLAMASIWVWSNASSAGISVFRYVGF